MPHWRRLGKLFVSGQLRETFPPSKQGEGQVEELEEQEELEVCKGCQEEGKKEQASAHCAECNELLCR